MLSKHPGLCRFPHGHSRRVEIVLAAAELDGHDMVCDFKAVKLAVKEFLDKLDHAMAMNRADPMVKAMMGPRAGPAAGAGNAGSNAGQMMDRPMMERVVLFDQDPTTEVLARYVFEYLDGEIRAGKTYHDVRGDAYRFPAGLVLERVRVSETSSSWAEYGR